MKEENKQRKQKLKDEKRKRKKKFNFSRKFSTTVKQYDIPNIREVPDNCKHLVKKGDVVYGVPGDGYLVQS